LLPKECASCCGRLCGRFSPPVARRSPPASDDRATGRRRTPWRTASFLPINNSIANSNIQHNDGYGIALLSAQNTTITNCNVQNNGQGAIFIDPNSFGTILQNDQIS
jgi:parallel beta-helix repeat protein